MAYQIVPLDACEDQEVYVTVEVKGNNIPLSLRVRWNEEGGFFVMAISDGRGSALLAGVPLVTGLAPAENLLSAYEYLGIGEAVLLPATEADAHGVPSLHTLGRDYLLIWGDGA